MQAASLPRFLALFSLFAPLRLWAAPPPSPTPGTPGVKDIETVYNLARTLHDTLQCSPVTPGGTASPENAAAAVEFGNLGSLYAFAIAHYPADMKGDRISQLNTLIDGATNAYSQAYACDPSPENVLYLHRAIALLQVHLTQLDPTHPRAEEFRNRTTMLSARLPEAKTCPVCEEQPPAPPPLPVTGYHARYAGRLALGIGLGGGRSRIDNGTSLSHFTLRLTLGPRFTFGKNRRGIFGTGLSYTLHSIRQVDGEAPGESSALHQAGPYLEVGIAPVTNFSLQAYGDLAVTAGVVSLGQPNDPHSFHSINPGGGGSLCTLGSALCARVHGYGSITGDATKLGGWDLTLHFDFFRLADFVIDHRARNAEQPNTSPRAVSTR